MLLVFLYQALHELGIDGTILAKHSIGELGGIDPLELLRSTFVNTHDLVEAYPEAGLVFLHA